MPTDYTDLAESLALAKERAKDAAATEDAIMTDFLTISAGTLSGTTYYRPYYTAALWLEQNPPDQTLLESEGTKFTNLEPVIRSLFLLQAGLDKSLGLTIPEGMESPPPGSKYDVGTSTSSVVTLNPIWRQDPTACLDYYPH